MECLKCGSNRVEELTLYRCPDCGAQVVSNPPRKLHPIVLPSDYLQTIDALRAENAQIREVVIRTLEVLSRDLMDDTPPSADDIYDLYTLMKSVGLENTFELMFGEC